MNSFVMTKPVEKSRYKEKGTESPFRYLAEEMLQKYDQRSVDENLWRKRYEEAAFQVYGTLPSGYCQTVVSTGANCKTIVIQDCQHGYITGQLKACRRHYEQATFIVYGTDTPHTCPANFLKDAK